MMWNFFVMFFYEASLEISMSIVIGVKYIWAFDSRDSGLELADDPQGNNALTR